MVYERRHTRELDDFGGLMESVPRYTQALRFMTLASVGLPGLSGFVGEFLVFVGAFQAGGASRIAAVVATPVLVLSAVYLLWMFQKVAMGPLDKDENRNLEDLTCRESALLAPLVALILMVGIFPQTIVRCVQPSAQHLAEAIKSYHSGSAWSYEVPVFNPRKGGEETP